MSGTTWSGNWPPAGCWNKLIGYPLRGSDGVSINLTYFLLPWVLCAAVASGHAGEPQLRIQRTDKAPVIDGVLDDALWKEATRVTEFYQREPVEGVEVSEATEAFLAYDSDMLYVGVRLYDREPGAIVARELREDEEMMNDDIFSVAIDSMLDRKNAFLFYLNALGTKGDARIENNTSFRREWNGIWYGAASRDDQGWIAEFAIPFKTLSMDVNAPAWGLELERYIRRRNEFATWGNYDQDKSFFYVAAYGDLVGLEDLDQGLGLDIKPQAATRYRRRYDGGDKDLTIKPGAEIIYKLTPSLNGSLIVNPDFSNAIVDDVKTNLTRFDLFFPGTARFFCP